MNLRLNNLILRPLAFKADLADVCKHLDQNETKRDKNKQNRNNKNSKKERK